MMMNAVTVKFNEPLHHVCLMHGLAQTFKKMPLLNKKVLEVRGKVVAIDNVVAPPPKMRNPQRVRGAIKSRSLIEVSYWNDKFSVEYRVDMCHKEDVIEFVQTLMQQYLQLRHPYMNTEFIDGKCRERSNGKTIAEMQNYEQEV